MKDVRETRGTGLRVPAKAAREDTRATNLRLVLQLLLSGDPMSRADLARATGLTPATVSALVAELHEDGLVIEAPARPHTGRVGKPPTMLQIRPDGRDVIAIDLSDPQVLRASVVDLAGGIVTAVERAAGGVTGADAVAQVVDLAVEAVGRSANPILGVGIGTPGVTAGGVVVEASNFGWHGVDLAGAVRSATGHPTHVRNDANVAAIAEYARGGHHRTNLAVVKIGLGVGAGFVLNGSLFEGEHAGAGEIGHLVVDPDGPPCRCGHRGCLETFLSIPAIQAGLGATNGPAKTVAAAAERLGIAMAAIVAILDIDRIFVAGPRALLGLNFCQIATASLRTRCLHSVAESVSVDYTSLGHDVVLLGAAGLVMSQELGVA